MSEKTNTPKAVATPSSHWHAEGQADPHAGHYDGERAALIMGNLTDDQLANAAFMFYNDYPSLQDVMDGKAFPPIAYMTAVKDRIRWLSRSLERVVSERDALAAELKAVRGDQTPTVEDINLQEWKGMDGACAWHLIDRHAEDWHHTARLMNAWLEANREDLVAQVAQLSAAMRDASEFAYQAQKELKALREQKPSCWTTYPPSGRYSKCKAEVDLWERNNWTIVPLYTHPVPAREMTDADIALCIASADKSFAQERISGKPVLGVWSKHLARAIERYLKGEGK